MTDTIIVPPPPYQSPVADKNGNVTPIWGKWLNQMYLRSGGANQPSTQNLVSDIQTLQSSVGALQVALADETTALQNQVNGLSVGRQL